LDKQEIVFIALGRSGEDARRFALDDLVKASNTNRDKENLRRDIRDRTLVLDARMGGLSEDGLFDPKEEKEALTADTDEDWQKKIGFRVRSVAPGAEETDPDWHKPHLFDLRRDGEGNPLRQLRIEKYRDATATEDERAISPSRAQRLDEHEEWTACKARKLVEALGLDGDIGDAIVLAAQLHDEGKKAKRWQRAFNAPNDGKAYAKTKGPINQSRLGGYRHEFGSLPRAEGDEKFQGLSPGLRDLVLHLIAAHHGRARPVIETEGCEDAPPSVLEERARDVALRFARLQKGWGPWGLAWWEALLRAADQQASRDNDERAKVDGGR
jgi:CRISPR-associated endonuclease/helicase Cas3